MRALRTLTTIAVLGTTLGGGAALAAAQTGGGAETAGITASSPSPTARGAAGGGSAHLGLGWVLRLSATDRACLDKADVRRPVGPLSEGERAAVKADVVAAAKACGMTVPDGSRSQKAKAFWQGLTDEQTACLRKADVTRPIGPLSKTERKQVRTALRAAEKACGVERPKAASS